MTFSSDTWQDIRVSPFPRKQFMKGMTTISSYLNPYWPIIDFNYVSKSSEKEWENRV